MAERSRPEHHPWDNDLFDALSQVECSMHDVRRELEARGLVDHLAELDRVEEAYHDFGHHLERALAPIRAAGGFDHIPIRPRVRSSPIAAAPECLTGECEAQP